MSKLVPVMWNSVVAGKWNPAILTPKGISVEIFDIDNDNPIEILVPLNAMGPAKVRIDNFFTSADFDKLVIDCENYNWESLDKSRLYCVNAIKALPKTPVTAAGFNVRYELQDPDDDFIELLEPKLDNNIADSTLSIVSGEIRRSLEWGEGCVNLHIISDVERKYKILLNFDLKSTDKDKLIGWLKKPIKDVETFVEKILHSTLKIRKEETI